MDKTLIYAAAVLVVAILALIALDNLRASRFVSECKTAADCKDVCTLECVGARMVCDAGSCKCTCTQPTPPPLPDEPLPGSECTQDSDCFVGGCSSQVCSPDEGIITTCEWREEYGCVRLSSCKCIKGKCSWEENADYLQCLKATSFGSGEYAVKTPGVAFLETP